MKYKQTDHNFFFNFIVGIRVSQMYNCQKEISILELGFQHSFEKAPRAWIRGLTVDTET